MGVSQISNTVHYTIYISTNENQNNITNTKVCRFKIWQQSQVKIKFLIFHIICTQNIIYNINNYTTETNLNYNMIIVTYIRENL